ncbi:hypothetical protein HK102_009815 [Quaeritorhiza haematococci]|nr:hypothetical protein HK102_009815 [Quaeritorhiza haematococci]
MASRRRVHDATSAHQLPPRFYSSNTSATTTKNQSKSHNSSHLHSSKRPPKPPPPHLPKNLASNVNPHPSKPKETPSRTDLDVARLLMQESDRLRGRVGDLRVQQREEGIQGTSTLSAVLGNTLSKVSAPRMHQEVTDEGVRSASTVREEIAKRMEVEAGEERISEEDILSEETGEEEELPVGWSNRVLGVTDATLSAEVIKALDKDTKIRPYWTMTIPAEDTVPANSVLSAANDSSATTIEQPPSPKSTTTRIYVIDDYHSAETLLLIVKTLAGPGWERLRTVGFDTETTIRRPYKKMPPGSFTYAKAPSTIQIAFSDDLVVIFRVWRMCGSSAMVKAVDDDVLGIVDSKANVTALVNNLSKKKKKNEQLWNRAKFPALLKQLLQTRNIMKVGVGAVSDAGDLKQFFDVEAKNLLDLDAIAGSIALPKKSLASITYVYCNKHKLEKSFDLIASNWDGPLAPTSAMPLRQPQQCKPTQHHGHHHQQPSSPHHQSKPHRLLHPAAIEYAAADAVWGLRCYRGMVKLPDEKNVPKTKAEWDIFTKPKTLRPNARRVGGNQGRRPTNYPVTIIRNPTSHSKANFTDFSTLLLSIMRPVGFAVLPWDGEIFG